MRAAGLQGRVVKVTRRAPGVHRFFEATNNLRVATAPPTAINQQWVGSVNRPRCCQDNAHMESFFHTLKTEWIRGRTFATFAELEVALKAYIRLYNHQRLHSSIGYHTPKEYERLVA